MLGLGNRGWYFYIASLLIHGLLACGLSLLPQGFLLSFHEGRLGEEVYQVRFLGEGGGRWAVASKKKRTASKGKSTSRVVSPLKKEEAKVRPGAGKRMVFFSKAAQRARIVKRDRDCEACRGPVQGGVPSKREGLESSSMVSLTGRGITWILNEPGYGEEDLVAGYSAILDGGGRGVSGDGKDSKHRGGGLVPPVPLVRDKPPYPPLARKRGYEGRLVVRFLVTPRGLVDKVTLVKSSGYSILDRAAVKTVKRWRFSPATKRGRPIPYWVEVPVVFDLKGS